MCVCVCVWVGGRGRSERQLLAAGSRGLRAARENIAAAAAAAAAAIASIAACLLRRALNFIARGYSSVAGVFANQQVARVAGRSVAAFLPARAAP